MTDPAIRWPQEFDPSNSPVHVHNELAMSASPEVVWAWLVCAELWPTWYENSKKVRVQGKGPNLVPGARFRWRTFGVNIESQVVEFVPTERLGVCAYHAWLIRKAPGGCHVLTEETQHGWLARLGNLLLPNRMHRFHQIWLEGLQGKALTGLPPSSIR